MPGLESFMPDSTGKRRRQTDQARAGPPKSDRAPATAGGSLGRGRGRAPEEDPGEPGPDFDEEAEGAPPGLEAESESEAEAEPEGVEVLQGTKFEADAPSETGSCVLLSVSYSGDRGRALAKLYDVERGRILFWYDNTGHQPYLLTDMPLGELLGLGEVTSHDGFDRTGCTEVEKYDLLRDSTVRMTKVAAKDPTSIGGRGTGIRDLLGERSWEDHIRYHECFVYDRRLVPGYYYRVSGGSLVPEKQAVPLEAIREAFPGASQEFLKSLAEWFPIFSSPVPNYRRAAIDIEVETETQDRIPDPQVAANPVICVSVAATDGRRQVLLLSREGVVEGERPPELPGDVELSYFDSEIELLKEVFAWLVDYPILLTFNGDNFDLHYLWNRAQRLGMRKDEIPIVMGREIAVIPVGVHVDLYKFFHNHAIQVYAFGNAYKELTLDAISEALLGIKKIQLDKSINELDYLQLANYCFRDSQITLMLSTEHSGLVMNLLTLIMRISRVSIEDATRQGVSSWIRSLFYDEHRKDNYLIPRKEDISITKGGSSTTAVIKGKKYKGALVIKPESGVFFNVIVLDFASLYPSIIARWNLSYETVRCPHPECRKNLVPDTDHWVCTRRVGMMAHVVGLLREVRVRWFKPKSKDPSLSEEAKNYYKVVQQALKVLLNASYGVFGAEIFPLYCLPLADSTTAIGRSIITETIDRAKELGMKVLYSDTDSIFLRQPTKEQIGSLLSWAESKFGIDLEIDKRYTFVTFSGRKKNYLGVLDSGVVDIKGLMGKKRNTPPFIKSAFAEMTHVLREVKTPQDFEAAKSRIKSIVQRCYSDLKARRIPLDDLVFKVMVSRRLDRYDKTTPQHVKAAKLLEEKGKEVKPGDLISFVKVQGPLGVKPVQLARIDEVDVEKYVGHIESTFGQVLEALNVDFEEIVGVKRLDFFSR